MPHDFHITITNTESGEKEKLDGQFSDKDWALLTRFLSKWHRLAECRIAETRKQLNFGVSGGGEKPVTFTASLPPEDDIAAFLHRMRPFVLKRETTNFGKTRNILARYLAHPMLRKHLDKVRDLYDGKSVPFYVGVNDTTITPDETVNTWLYADEYHQDDDKLKELDALYNVFPEPSARALFLTYMLERASAIGKLAAIIEDIAKGDSEPRPLRP